jgi:4-hydroxy-3-methylbut-2-enyl diphosphate reductase
MSRHLQPRGRRVKVLATLGPASASEAVIARLSPRDGVEEVRITEEDEYFPPPRNLRDLQTAIETAATAMSGGSLANRPQVDDRALAASAVLASL